MKTFTRRAYNASLDLQAGDRTLVATITTEAVDRYSEVILSKGIDLSEYRKNPVVLWSHECDEPAIGRCQWVKASEDKKGLIAKVQFAETEDAEEVWQLYKGGYLQAFSIGARPIEGSPPTPDEIRKRPELAACKWVWRKIAMTELSAVNVPANPEALAMAISKGLRLSDSIRRSLGVEDAPQPVDDAVHDEPPTLPPLIGRSFQAAHADLLKTIRSERPEAIARRLLADELDRLMGRV